MSMDLDAPVPIAAQDHVAATYVDLISSYLTPLWLTHIF